MQGRVLIHPEVQQAIDLGRPVVALETAVTTTGLPRQPLKRPAGRPDGWRDDQPMNVEMGLLMQRIVRDWGAMPATVAVIDGTLHIGLEDEQLEHLALNVHEKVSVSGLAAVMADGCSAGTTVSATLAACRVTSSPIRVFATGGIGGVHLNWTQLPDVSADLREMAVTPTCVVCAGAKSILDVPATLEALEALGVPVLGYATDVMPQFQSLGSDALSVPRRTDTVAHVAKTCQLQWNALGRSSGVLLANPIPQTYAVREDELTAATQRAEREANDAGIGGAARTPHLLTEVARLTDGRSLHANIALLENNAALAGELAVALAAAS